MRNPFKHHTPKYISQEQLNLFRNVVLGDPGSNLDKALADLFEHADINLFNKYMEKSRSKIQNKSAPLLVETCNLVLQGRSKAYISLKRIVDGKCESGSYNDFCRARFESWPVSDQRLLQYITSYDGPEKRVSYNLMDFKSVPNNTRATMRILVLMSMQTLVKSINSQNKIDTLVNLFFEAYQNFVTTAWLCYRDGQKRFDLPELSAEHKQLVSMVPSLGDSKPSRELITQSRAVTYGSDHPHAGEHLPPVLDGSGLHHHDEPERFHHQEYRDPLPIYMFQASERGYIHNQEPRDSMLLNVFQAVKRMHAYHAHHRHLGHYGHHGHGGFDAGLENLILNQQLTGAPSFTGPPPC